MRWTAAFGLWETSTIRRRCTLGGPLRCAKRCGSALTQGVQLVAPECAIPLATKLENLLEIPRAVKEWHGEHD